MEIASDTPPAAPQAYAAAQTLPRRPPGRRRGGPPATLEEARQRREARERRQRVDFLYFKQGLSRAVCAEIEEVSERTIGNDLKELGKDARPAGRPRVYPAAEERPCENCERLFTPGDAQAARGDGNTCSVECAAAARCVHPDVAERVCARKGCGRAFRPTRYDAAAGKGRFCSMTCSAVDRWLTGRVWRNLKTAPIKHWKSRTSQIWRGRWGGFKEPGPGALARGKPRQYSDEQMRLARVVLERDPKIGRGRLSRLAGVSEKQARAMLADLRSSKG